MIRLAVVLSKVGKCYLTDAYASSAKEALTPPTGFEPVIQRVSKPVTANPDANDNSLCALKSELRALSPAGIEPATSTLR